MPRPPRIEAAGCFYHVNSNGNNGGPMFWDDFDRAAFLLILERVARRYGWVIYSYCLMTTHYHFVVAINDRGLSDGMRDLNGGYARRTNTRYGRTGHLLRNHFHDELIESDAHLLESCRYDVLNPVKARMCRHPGDYRWSSYRATAGLDFAPPFLAVDEVLRLFHPHPREARRLYRRFVADGHVPVSDTVARV